MNLETFFERFDLFADAPNAVAKLRELVLEWATTGRLCNSRSGDWREAKLGDVIELISGQHLLAHEHNRDGQGIPYLTGPADFGPKHPVPTRWTEHPKVIAQPGDILITVKGAGIGKTNVLVDRPTAISRQLMAIRVVAADPEFVHIVVKRAVEHFQDSRTGIAIPGIGRTEVLNLKLILPPLAVQKRIVEKVDELMALCDRLEAQQKERETRHAALARASLSRFADAPTPSNLNFIFHKSYDISPADLRKTILTLAVQGKLVPQDPNDEPAVEQDRSATTEIGNGLPWDIPDSWTVMELNNLATFINGDRSKNYPSKSFRVADGVPFINAGHLVNGDVSLTEMDYITEEHFALLGSGKVERGDVLYCLRGSLGKSAVVSSIVRGAIASSLLILRPTNLILAKYLYFYLVSPLGAFMIRRYDNGSAQPNLSATNVKRYAVPLPPVAEQLRIVMKAEELMVKVDTLENQINAAETTAQKLTAAVVAELTA
jgi:type I restriction enzyme S subunit